MLKVLGDVLNGSIPAWVAGTIEGHGGCVLDSEEAGGCLSVAAYTRCDATAHWDHEFMERKSRFIVG